jgi:hypothetical protein
MYFFFVNHSSFSFHFTTFFLLLSDFPSFLSLPLTDICLPGTWRIHINKANKGNLVFMGTPEPSQGIFKKSSNQISRSAEMLVQKGYQQWVANKINLASPHLVLLLAFAQLGTKIARSDR